LFEVHHPALNSYFFLKSAINYASSNGFFSFAGVLARTSNRDMMMVLGEFLYLLTVISNPESIGIDYCSIKLSNVAIILINSNLIRAAIPIFE